MTSFSVSYERALVSMPQSTHKPKRPPYSRQLVGDLRTVRIIAGFSQAWGRAKTEIRLGYTDLIVWPADTDPITYRWPVRDREALVIAVGCAIDHARLAEALIRDQARWVVVLQPDAPEPALPIFYANQGRAAA